MRNLALHAINQFAIPNADIEATALDLDQDTLYAASAKLNLDAGTEVEIWRTTSNDDSPRLFSKYKAASYTAEHPFGVSQIVSFRVLPDARVLACVTRGGDIATVPLDDDSPETEIVGSVESGILSAEWNPDDSLLVLVTGDGKLMIMTPTFDVLSEAPLDTTDFGADAPINVGWGSKQTQFHGSLGKSAAQAGPTPSDSIGASPDDDLLPRVSWRGDGALFSVSVLTPGREGARARRTMRVYDRLGALQATGEPVPGLEGALAWRPSGSLIAGTQRFGFEGGGAGKEGRHDVVFFERNGLRHGDFGLRVGGSMSAEAGVQRKWGYRIRELVWSSDSSVLAVWVEGAEVDTVQLWTTGNYHWYLKHEILAPSSKKLQECRFTSVAWHPEAPLELILTTKGDIIRRTYAFETWASHSQIPVDSGTVAVIDGDKLLLTPFRTQNVPPPMSSHQLTPHPSPNCLIKTSIHAALAPEQDVLAVAYEDGWANLWDLHTRLGPGKEAVMRPELIWQGQVEGEGALRQVVVFGDEARQGQDARTYRLVTLHAAGEQDRVVVTVVWGGGVHTTVTTPMDRNGRLVPQLPWGCAWQGRDGVVLEVELDTETPSFPDPLILTAPSFCPSSLLAPGHHHQLFIGLTASGALLVGARSYTSVLTLATNTTSFTTGASFLIYTTSAHLAHFAPLTSLEARIAALDRAAHDPTFELPAEEVWETRRIERGARIVTAVPSACALVLQMPRGNLETVCPRPLVMAVVRRDVHKGRWREAFLACRKHRVELSVLVEEDRARFLGDVKGFVGEVREVEYLNLFLTNIGQSSMPDDAVGAVCDAIRAELEKQDLTTYIHSILTAYAAKRPADLDAGLALLLRLRSEHPALVEDAVKYAVFLADADTLFDAALGMHDLALVLLVAQHAQKDPREYLPFLRELRALPPAEQRFRIDDHLRRRARALRHLADAGAERFQQAMEYVERWRLYEEALKIWQGTERYAEVLEVYAEYLFERREFGDAALVFVQAHRPQKALVAYERALDWRALFALAFTQHPSSDEIKEVAYRVAEELGAKKRHADAGRVLLDYCADVRGAAAAFAEGRAFGEARRIIAMHPPAEDKEDAEREDLVKEIIEPALLEAAAQSTEDLAELLGQLRKQRARVAELRVKRDEDPEAFFGADDPRLADVDVRTDASAFTAFTRYTAAPSTSVASTKKTARSKKKRDRQAASGRKGTVDEEAYLLQSLSKLVVKFGGIRGEVNDLLPHLLEFTPAHRDAARTLRADTTAFETELLESVEQIWAEAPSAEPGDTSAHEPLATGPALGLAAGLGAAGRISAVGRVPRPVLVAAPGGGGAPLDVVLRHG